MRSSSDSKHIYGINTKFTKQLKPRMSIGLSSSLGGATGEVLEVISDTELILKKELNREQARSALISVGDSQADEAIKYKVMPYIDQHLMYKSVYDRLEAGGCIGIFPEGNEST